MKVSLTIGGKEGRPFAGFMQAIRREDLMKKPGNSETLDWAEALLKLNRGVLNEAIVEQTLG